MLAIITTFLATWIIVFMQYKLGVKAPSPLYFLMSIITMWIPGIIAFVCGWFEDIPLPLFSKPNKTYFQAGLTGIAVVLVSFVLSISFSPLRSFDPLFYKPPFSYGLLIGTMISLGLVFIAGITVNMLAALGEELMWRGYLWEKLKHYGFLKASFIIGLLWGLWHVPGIVLLGHNYPIYPLQGILWMVILTIAMSPLFTYYRIKGKSIMVPAALHGTINALGPAVVLFFENPNFFVVGATGVCGIISFALFSVIASIKVKQDRLVQ